MCSYYQLKLLSFTRFFYLAKFFVLLITNCHNISFQLLLSTDFLLATLKHRLLISIFSFIDSAMKTF